MKIAIIGGHLTPALSVIEALSKEDEVIYIGRKYPLEGDLATSLEYKTITEKNIRFFELKTGRLQRSLTRRTVPSVLKLPVGFIRASNILVREKPDVVVGFGGYVSLPVGVAANLLRMPLVIHEQTQEIGLANKLLSKFATKICISFENSRKYFPRGKVILTGNPVRQAILSPRKIFEKPSERPLIFITGGSLGSHAINSLVEESLDRLLSKYALVHQTGAAEEFKDYDRLLEKRANLSEEKRSSYIISKFYSPDEIGAVFKKADLVICRAGINTVSEIIALKKPAFLIPISFSQKNEQLKNAHLIKKIGLGEVEEQKHLTPEQFLKIINYMMDDLTRYQPKKLPIDFPKNAAQKIIEVIYESSKKPH